MEDVILIIAVAAVMIFGFFIMKRLDVFLEENRKAIENAAIFSLCIILTLLT